MTAAYKVGGNPSGLAFAGGELWVSFGRGTTLGRVVASFSVPGTPADVRRGADGTAWVAEKERDTVTRIDPSANRILDVSAAGNGAFSIAVAAGDTWVTSYAGNDIWRFRT
jgi:hypothetical protein